MSSIGDDLARAYEDGYANGSRDGTEKAQEQIDSAPTIDPARHARWTKYGRCTACDGLEPCDDEGSMYSSDYCPGCGARMDAEVISEMETTTEEEKDG